MKKVERPQRLQMQYTWEVQITLRSDMFWSVEQLFRTTAKSMSKLSEEYLTSTVKSMTRLESLGDLRNGFGCHNRSTALDLERIGLVMDHSKIPHLFLDKGMTA